MDTRKEGVAVVVIAGVLALLALMFSSGYFPQHGLLYSLQETMVLVDWRLFCSAGDPATQYGGCYDGTHIKIMTKYAIAVLFAVAAYGGLLSMGLVPSIKGMIDKGMQ